MVKTNTVKIMTLSGVGCDIDCEFLDSLGQLKLMIEIKMSIEVCRQRLVMGDTVLRDDMKSLKALGVEPGATLTVGKSQFPKPTITDTAKVKELLEANNYDGLAVLARQGYRLDGHHLDGRDGEYDLLHTAAKRGNLEIVQLCVDAGVSPFSLTHTYIMAVGSTTALMVAAKHNQKEVCAFLIDEGLDPLETTVMVRRGFDGTIVPIETVSAVQGASRNGHRLLADWLAVQPSAERERQRAQKKQQLSKLIEEQEQRKRAQAEEKRQLSLLTQEQRQRVQKPTPQVEGDCLCLPRKCLRAVKAFL